MGDREEGEDADLESQEAETAARRGAWGKLPGLEKEQEEKK